MVVLSVIAVTQSIMARKLFGSPQPYNVSVCGGDLYFAYGTYSVDSIQWALFALFWAVAVISAGMEFLMLRKRLPYDLAVMAAVVIAALLIAAIGVIAFDFNLDVDKQPLAPSAQTQLLSKYNMTYAPQWDGLVYDSSMYVSVFTSCECLQCARTCVTINGIAEQLCALRVTAVSSASTLQRAAFTQGPYALTMLYLLVVYYAALALEMWAYRSWMNGYQPFEQIMGF